MDLGVHLPLLSFDGEPLSSERVGGVAETARECGFAALAANDHLVFQRPWLDGPTALASVIERSGAMTLAMTASLAVVRGPVAVAKALAAIDLLSGGRLIAAIGAGSSRRDYEAVGVPFEERWARYDEALVDAARALAGAPAGPPRDSAVGGELGLEGRAATGRRGGRRVAGLGLQHDAGALRRRRSSELGAMPNALATMWTWVTDDRADAERVAARRARSARCGREPGRAARQRRASARPSTAPSCSRATPRPAAGASTSGRWATSARQLERIAGEVMPALARRASAPPA